MCCCGRPAIRSSTIWLSGSRKACRRNAEGPPLPDPTRSCGTRRAPRGGAGLVKRNDAEHIPSREALDARQRSLEPVSIESKRDSASMSKVVSTEDQTAPANSSGFRNQLWRQAPYLIAL